eukprot:TRINITY_DN5797_c0_g1_i1.p1 TRINITY_DN5797_c0_g1~~TRINITY_DN5797_c0_g1_i1.p1  ORF type:complete len:665 (+),score=141.64 TRINITY_DN5797_c0_g1_i1:85-1995(+)
MEDRGKRIQDDSRASRSDVCQRFGRGAHVLCVPATCIDADNKRIGEFEVVKATDTEELILHLSPSFASPRELQGAATPSSGSQTVSVLSPYTRPLSLSPSSLSISAMLQQQQCKRQHEQQEHQQQQQQQQVSPPLISPREHLLERRPTLASQKRLLQLQREEKQKQQQRHTTSGSPGKQQQGWSRISSPQNVERFLSPGASIFRESATELQPRRLFDGWATFSESSSNLSLQGRALLSPFGLASSSSTSSPSQEPRRKQPIASTAVATAVAVAAAEQRRGRTAAAQRQAATTVGSPSLPASSAASSPSLDTTLTTLESPTFGTRPQEACAFPREINSAFRPRGPLGWGEMPAWASEETVQPSALPESNCQLQDVSLQSEQPSPQQIAQEEIQTEPEQQLQTRQNEQHEQLSKNPLKQLWLASPRRPPSLSPSPSPPRSEHRSALSLLSPRCGAAVQSRFVIFSDDTLYNAPVPSESRGITSFGTPTKEALWSCVPVSCLDLSHTGDASICRDPSASRVARPMHAVRETRMAGRRPLGEVQIHANGVTRGMNPEKENRPLPDYADLTQTGDEIKRQQERTEVRRRVLGQKEANRENQKLPTASLSDTTFGMGQHRLLGEVSFGNLDQDVFVEAFGLV